MKGYRIIPEKYEPKQERELVGCQRCRECWYEDRIFYNSLRINGPNFCYHICDKCKRPSDNILGDE